MNILATLKNLVAPRRIGDSQWHADYHRAMQEERKLQELCANGTSEQIKEFMKRKGIWPT